MKPDLRLVSLKDFLPLLCVTLGLCLNMGVYSKEPAPVPLEPDALASAVGSLKICGLRLGDKHEELKKAYPYVRPNSKDSIKEAGYFVYHCADVDGPDHAEYTVLDGEIVAIKCMWKSDDIKRLGGTNTLTKGMIKRLGKATYSDVFKHEGALIIEWRWQTKKALVMLFAGEHSVGLSAATEGIGPKIDKIKKENLKTGFE